MPFCPWIHLSILQLSSWSSNNFEQSTIRRVRKENRNRAHSETDSSGTTIATYLNRLKHELSTRTTRRRRWLESHHCLFDSVQRRLWLCPSREHSGQRVLKNLMKLALPPNFVNRGLCTRSRVVAVVGTSENNRRPTTYRFQNTPNSVPRARGSILTILKLANHSPLIGCHFQLFDKWWLGVSFLL